MGGDEFAIVLSDLERPEEAAMIAERIIQCFAMPIEINQCQCEVGISIGISVFPLHGDNIEQIIQSADKAMYQVKQSGKNKYRFST